MSKKQIETIETKIITHKDGIAMAVPLSRREAVLRRISDTMQQASQFAGDVRQVEQDYGKQAAAHYAQKRLLNQASKRHAKTLFDYVSEAVENSTQNRATREPVLTFDEDGRILREDPKPGRGR